MPRDTQYQPVGNPLQVDRLPDTRPIAAFPYQPLNAAAEATLSLRVIYVLAALSAGAMISQTFQIGAQGGAVRSFVFENTVFIVVGLFFLVRAIRGVPTPGQPEALVCLGLAFVYFNWPPPLSVHLLVVSACLSLLTWLVGRHWIAFCTASPVTREAAKSLSETLTGFLLPLAAIPVGLFIAAQFLTPALILCLIAAIPLVQVVLLWTALSGEWDISAAKAALSSWLTYNPSQIDVPGTLVSPAGGWGRRIALTAGCVLLVAITLVRVPLEGTAAASGAAAPFSAILGVLSVVPPEPQAVGGSTLDTAARWLVWLAAIVLVPVPLVLVTPVVLLLPLLINAAQFRRLKITPEDWQNLTAELSASEGDDPARSAVFVGRLHCDRSPVLVPFSVYGHHAHFLGDSGSGKTARGISPTIEQLIAPGNCSLIAIDLKGDSHELFGSVLAGAELARARTGNTVPVKYFTNKLGQATFAFNPLAQSYQRLLTSYLKTDIQCGALGLTYGADYGEGYYSSANSAVLYHTIKQYPDVTTYQELAERVGYVVANAKKSELHPEIRKSGVHVQTVLDRLGSFDALNVSSTSGHPREVVENSIDLAQAFIEPQVIYFQLSSMLGPGSAPEIARLVAYSLLAAATQTERRRQVYLVIDEFQRMVAQNLEYMLQLARSMNVGVILANQTMEDLRTSRSNLIPTIETNCRYRQWFSVSALEDRKRLIQSSGETVEVEVSRSYSNGERGATATVSYSERVVPRLTENDILLASDDPSRSILKISRGEGYAQYGGMPVIVESDFHITKDEYEQRVTMPWPENAPGTFVPRAGDDSPAARASAAPTRPPAASVGPTVTTEVIGGAPHSAVDVAVSSGNAAQGLFERVQDPAVSRRSRRRKTP